MKLFWIWTSGLVSHLELWWPLCLAEWDHLCNFGRGQASRGTVLLNYFEFRPVVQISYLLYNLRNNAVKLFWIWTSGSDISFRAPSGSRVQWSGTIYASLRDFWWGLIYFYQFRLTLLWPTEKDQEVWMLPPRRWTARENVYFREIIKCLVANYGIVQGMCQSDVNFSNNHSGEGALNPFVYLLQILEATL